MRAAFANTIIELATGDPRVLLLTGDLGYTVLESFAQRFPKRFFNLGVAEQNMVGVATGLAEAGLIPFVYSIVTFATLRPYEFIRNGPVQHRLPVRIVGVGGGVEYGNNGLSHYGLEDVAVMRAQPGLTVIAPADHQQARAAIQASWQLPGPVYYRLGKDDQTVVPGLDGRFELGKVQRIGHGSDLLFIAMGNVAKDAVAAMQTLAGQAVSCSVVIVAHVNAAPIEELARILSQFPVVITVEAHYVSGGVGSLIAEIIAEGGIRCRLLRCGFRENPGGITGSQAYLHQRFGISPEKLADTALAAVGKTR